MKLFVGHKFMWLALLLIIAINVALSPPQLKAFGGGCCKACGYGGNIDPVDSKWSNSCAGRFPIFNCYYVDCNCLSHGADTGCSLGYSCLNTFPTIFSCSSSLQEGACGDYQSPSTCGNGL